jgi:predicted CopG family antitoxin
MMLMVKSIKIQDDNYSHLLTILHELEKRTNERQSFDKVISLLVNEYKKHNS